MQQNQKKIHKKLFICISGSAWVAGLLIAGSDNPYMPWVNGLGLFLFVFASALIGRYFRPAHYSTESSGSKRCARKQISRSQASEKRPKRIHMPVVPVGKYSDLQWN